MIQTNRPIYVKNTLRLNALNKLSADRQKGLIIEPIFRAFKIKLGHI